MMRSRRCRSSLCCQVWLTILTCLLVSNAEGFYSRPTSTVCVVKRMERCDLRPLSRQECLQRGCCYRFSFWRGSFCYKANMPVNNPIFTTVATTTQSPHRPVFHARKNPRKNIPVQTTQTITTTTTTSTTPAPPPTTTAAVRRTTSKATTSNLVITERPTTALPMMNDTLIPPRSSQYRTSLNTPATITTPPTPRNYEPTSAAASSQSKEKQNSRFMSLLERMVVENFLKEARPSSVVPSLLSSCPGGQRYPIQSCGGYRVTKEWCRMLGCCWMRSFMSNAGRCVVGNYVRRNIPKQHQIQTDNLVHLLASSGMNARYSNRHLSQNKENGALLDQARNGNTATEKNLGYSLLAEGYLNRRITVPQLSTNNRFRLNNIGSSQPVYTSPPHINEVARRPAVPNPVLTPEQNEKYRTVEKILRIVDDNAQIVSDRVCALSRLGSCCYSRPNSSCCRSHDPKKRPSPSTRVVGGGPAGRLKYSMAYISHGFYTRGFCGGTLISSNWVLTAAHCVLDHCNGDRRQTLMVSLGKSNTNPYLRSEGQQDLMVVHVVCHPTHCKFSDQPRLNDLALLRLHSPAYHSPTVSPAAIPLQYEEPPKFQDCITMGYGITRGTGHSQVLKEVSVPLITNQVCNQPTWRNCAVRPCMMCASDVNRALCDGDSGGPLFCARANGMFVLHGVYTWGRCGVEREKPSVYTRTSYFIDWIVDEIRKYA